MPNDIGLNAGVPTLAPWPGSAASADLTAETAARIAADTTLQNNINAIPVPVKLAADVANSVSATPVALGFAIAGVNGTPIAIRFKLFVVTGGAGGLTLKITHQGATAGTAFVDAGGTSTGAGTFSRQLNPLTASPHTVAIGASILAYTGNGVVDVFLVLVPNANGNIDLTIQPVTNGQSMTVKAGSYAQFVK